MTDATLAPAVQQQFRVFKVLGRSFSVLFRNIVPFGLLAVGVNLINTLVALAVGDLSERPVLAGLVGVITLIIFVLSYYVVMAALTYGTFQDLRGQRVSIGACISRGLSRMLPVLGVAVLSGLAMMLGFLALVIPAIIVLLMLWVAVPVSVVERPGVLASLKRSRALTKGSRWRILGLLFMQFLAILVVSIPLFVVVFIVALRDPSLLAEGSPIVIGLELLYGSFFMALSAVIVAVSYHDLRMIKDGIGTDEITAVFG